LPQIIHLTCSYPPWKPQGSSKPVTDLECID